MQLLDRGQTGIQPIDTTLVGGAVGGGWRDGAREVLEETLVSPGAGPGRKGRGRLREGRRGQGRAGNPELLSTWSPFRRQTPGDLQLSAHNGLKLSLRPATSQRINSARHLEKDFWDLVPFVCVHNWEGGEHRA